MRLHVNITVGNFQGWNVNAVKLKFTESHQESCDIVQREYP